MNARSTAHSPRALVAARLAGAVRVLAACGFAACGGYQHYQPAPLDADPPVAAAYRARNLSDSTLGAFLQRAGAASTSSGWTPRQLALAALFRRADLTEARATVAAAQAAGVTAGLRPEPSVSSSVGYASQKDEGKSSHWTVSLTSGLTFETGGKRAARLARARAGILAARLRLDATAWDITQAAAQAAVALTVDQREVQDASAEAAARGGVLTLLRARYAEGRINLADIAQAESDVRSAALATVQARQLRAEAEITLARALAVPASAVDDLPLRPAPIGGCETPVAARVDSLQAVALQHRFDVGAALADYAAAEADVRAEIGRQYPDVTIGPGLAWDQGVLRWALGVGTPGIPRARNRGPIAAALARRAAQAARVRMVQDSVLASVGAAVTGCQVAAVEVAAADSLRVATQRTVTVVQAAYDRGETGRTEVALAQLALLRTERSVRQALGRRALAGVALETATGVWLTGARRGP